jgi:hypothetical protein
MFASSSGGSYKFVARIEKVERLFQLLLRLFRLVKTLAHVLRGPVGESTSESVNRQVELVNEQRKNKPVGE